MTGGAGVSALSAVFAQDVWMALRAFSLRCAEGPADGFHWTAFFAAFSPERNSGGASLLFSHGHNCIIRGPSFLPIGLG